MPISVNTPLRVQVFFLCCWIYNVNLLPFLDKYTQWRKSSGFICPPRQITEGELSLAGCTSDIIPVQDLWFNTRCACIYANESLRHCEASEMPCTTNAPIWNALILRNKNVFLKKIKARPHIKDNSTEACVLIK